MRLFSVFLFGGLLGVSAVQDPQASVRYAARQDGPSAPASGSLPPADGSGQDADWVEGLNCPKGKGVVTDSVCCLGENFCSKLQTKEKCLADGDASLYCEWKDDKCLPAEDSKSDVCCMDKDVKNPCDSVLKGRCPEDWQVDEGCCSTEDGKKYSFLKTGEGKVCCNAPCKEMEAANCTSLPAKCGPQQRSFALHDPYHELGFYRDQGSPFQHQFGYILHGTGFGHDLGHGYRRFKPGKGRYKEVEEEDHYDYGKKNRVNEITMDDIMLMLIDALEKQTDPKIFEDDLTSDPYLGKRQPGGLFVDHNFPDADNFFDQIYGHSDRFVNPYEGYVRVYPEHMVGHQFPYMPQYQYPSHGPYSYPSYRPQGHGPDPYQTRGYVYPSHQPPSYQRQPHEYGYHGGPHPRGY